VRKRREHRAGGGVADMEWVETTGKTISEAKEAALDELGVDEQDAEFEVLAEPKVGLFGRLRSEGRVRARVRPTTPRAKEDRRDRRRRTRAGAATDSPGDASASDAPSDTTLVEEATTGGGVRATAKSPSTQPASCVLANGGGGSCLIDSPGWFETITKSLATSQRPRGGAAGDRSRHGRRHFGR
jgi:hypothetical protein